MTNLLRYKHLKARRIVDNWTQLKNLIDKYGFPAGFIPSPNTRAWFEDEVDAWLEARASAPDAKPLRGAAKQLHEATPEDRVALRKAFRQKHEAKSREEQDAA